VQARADAVLAEAATALDDGDVVLVGHGHFSRVLIARWIGLPATEGVRFAMDSASWAVLGHERGVPRLDHVNVEVLA
jgi:broad specificity phosphatase PhoE